MIKGVIFDMDGTLVDNKEAHEEAFRVWCESKGLELPAGFLLKYYGMGNDEIIPAVMNKPDLSKELIEEYSLEKEAIYREIYAKDIELVACLRKLLAALT